MHQRVFPIWRRLDHVDEKSKDPGIERTISRNGRFRGAWIVAAAPIATLALYSLVHVEGRFIAAQVTIILLVLYSGARFRHGEKLPRMTLTAMVLVITWSYALSILVLSRQFSQTTNYYVAAAAMQDSGIPPRSRLGLIWEEKWDAGAGAGAFVPRLARAKIVAEITEPAEFWNLPSEEQQKRLNIFRDIGANAVLTRNPPTDVAPGWLRLARTEYFIYRLNLQ